MFAKVIVDIVNSEVDRIFEYSFSENDGVKKGSRVLVPFGNKKIEGIVVDVQSVVDYAEDKIKPILGVLDDMPALTDETLSLADFIVKKYYVSKASALRLFLPSEMRNGRVKEKKSVYFNMKEGLNVEECCLQLKSSAKKQKELLFFLSENGKTESSELLKKFGRTTLSALCDKGFIFKTEEKINRSPYVNLTVKDKTVMLSQSQKNAVESVLSTRKDVSLIFGVTGSGKTEVYLDIINRTISLGKTAIMLVPEIALTPQMLKQLRARFGDTAAILHSGLSAGERYDEWWRLRSGNAKIAIGARSAVFAPLTNIGVIIIDEEHDGSYRSETSPRYSTLDLAIFRAKYYNAKVVLGSATPSLESYNNAIMGNYNLIEMPDRINKKPLPEFEIADMREEVKHGNNSYFSSILKYELEECLRNGKQAMIFLNQRGYSKTVVCTECGHVQKCENCDVALTYHKEDDSLLCHYCGAKYKMISSCTECGSKFLKYGGMGTERAVFELKALYPKARIIRMDRDTTRNKEGHFEILERFSRHDADILVGTQMIAKGHDFPEVTLVGILDADASLYFSDFRSAERTFQLITQVAGRSGRSDKAGKVVLQTYQPFNNILKHAISYDYKSFFEQELSVRKATAFPPFADIIRVLVFGENETLTLETTEKIYNDLKQIYEKNKIIFKFFGCMKAPIKRLQNKFRFQILMRIESGNQTIIDELFFASDKHKSKKTLVSFEVNPNNLT